MGHISYATSSFVHHFVTISEFRLELQSKNVQFGSKLAIFVACDFEIWRMYLKNNTAPLLCHFKLCEPFRSHWWIQTGVILQKCPIWVKIGDFAPVITKFIRCPLSTLGHLFYTTSSYVNHFVATCGLRLELWSGKEQIWAQFALTSVTLTFDLWL